MKIGLALLLLAPLLNAAKTLEIYVVDVEGGQATLLVAPSGQSMLIDTGWPGFNNRDSNRIAAAAKKAKVKQIDYLVVTHFHVDHAGGVPQIANKLPIKTVVTHGPNVETNKSAKELSEAFEAAVKDAQKLVVKPGDKIPIKGLDVTVLESDGHPIPSALPGAGAANPACTGVQPKEVDPGENARSVGLLITLGKFRFIDMGDLTWNKELELMCPSNRIGTADVYLTTHHGLDQSGSPAFVNAIHPRVAIMNNGATKGGIASAWQIVKDSPGLEDLWQVHFAVAGGKEHNSTEPFIANIDAACEGKYLHVSAEPTGGFTVTNSRNNYSKTYAAK